MPFRRARPREREAVLREELGRAVRILKDRGVVRIPLFGSLAESAVGPRSDIDLIVVEETDKPFMDRLDAIYSAVQPRVAMDILVYTPEEFGHLSRSQPFLKHALRGAKVLYERQSKPRC